MTTHRAAGGFVSAGAGHGAAAAPATPELLACLAMADPAGSTLPADAAAAAAQAAALARALVRSDDQARAGAWRCTQLLRLGRHGDVLREAPEVLALLQQLPALLSQRCELMRVLTLSASESGAFDVALDTANDLVRACAGSDDADLMLGSAFARAAAFDRMGDPWQAARLLRSALRDHGGSAADAALLVATNGLCAISISIIHRLIGTGADAEVRDLLARARAAGEQARAIVARAPNAAYEVAVLGNLGEVMLHQGDVADAEPLLRRSHALARQRGLGAHGWRVQTSIGDWLLANGRAAEALAAMRTLLAEMGSDAPQATFIRAHHAAYRACRALGHFEAALGHFEEVERSERRRAMAQLRAQSQLFVTRTEAQHAQWQAEQARADAKAQRERAAEFAATADLDPLTGLSNRRHLERRCAELLPAAQRDQHPLALAQIDIDHFKAINDRHGHAAGDRVLVAMAQLLRDNMRTNDVVSRHGGEEFVVVFVGTDVGRAAEICERLRERVAAHPWAALCGASGGVTISIGLTAAPDYALATLLQRADEALYRAKHAGRNRLCLTTTV